LTLTLFLDKILKGSWHVLLQHGQQRQAVRAICYAQKLVNNLNRNKMPPIHQQNTAKTSPIPPGE
jgi:hypothetical protein